MPIRPAAVVFDAIETLFAIEPLIPHLEAAGVPGAKLQLWYGRTLRDGVALDASGVYRPYAKVAVGTLMALMAEVGREPDSEVAERAVKAGFADLTPHPDAREAMATLRGAGIRVALLTNGNARTTETLVEKGGLQDLVERVISVEEVRHWKPHPAVYHHAAERLSLHAERLALVAAHAWDTHGAKRAGLLAGFVARRGEPFPAVMEAPDASGSSLLEVARQLAGWPAG